MRLVKLSHRVRRASGGPAGRAPLLEERELRLRLGPLLATYRYVRGMGRELSLRTVRGAP